MTFEIPKETYKENVNEVILGTGPKAFKLGGESGPAFHLFEGTWPNPPRFALEVYDTKPSDWSEALMEEYGEVLSNPVDWARKCAEFGPRLYACNWRAPHPLKTTLPLKRRRR